MNKKLFSPLQTDAHYFLAVFQHRNMTRASDYLGLSQTALTKAIARFEKELGFSLFQRTGRGLEPTQRAKDLAEKLGSMQKHWTELSLQGEAEFQQPVTLGAHTVVAGHFIPKAYPLLMKRNLFTSLDFKFAPSLQVCEKVNSGEWELGIVMNFIKQPGLISRHLSESAGVSLWGLTPHSPKKTLLYNPEQVNIVPYLKRVPHEKRIPIYHYHLMAKLVCSDKNLCALLPEEVAHDYPQLSTNNLFLERHPVKIIYRKEGLTPQGRKIMETLLESLK